MQLKHGGYCHILSELPLPWQIRTRKAHKTRKQGISAYRVLPEMGYLVSIKNVSHQKNCNYSQRRQKAVNTLNKEAYHNYGNTCDHAGDSTKTLAFFHVVSFFMLHLVFSPVSAFILNFGIIFPVIIMATPEIPNNN